MWPDWLIFHYRSHANTQTLMCVESRLMLDAVSHSPPQNSASQAATWGPKQKKKKKLAPAVGSRQRCTAAENSQDADASKGFQTEAPLSVQCPCSALQMSSLKAGGSVTPSMFP